MAAPSMATHFWDETKRVRWMLIVSITIVLVRGLGLFEDSAILKMLYYPARGCIGFIVAHVGYQQAFPYINSRDLLFRALGLEEFSEPVTGTNTQLNAAITYAGTCLLRGVIYGAFIIGSIMAV